MAEVREQLRRARLDAAARTLPFLSAFTALQLDAFVASLVAQLRQWHQFSRIERLLASPERLVRDIVLALRQERTPHGRPTTLYNLQINGDVQRGKSTVEAFTAYTVKLINDSPACRDRCFSVLGTHMVPWATDVKHKVEGAAARSVPPPAGAPPPEDDGAGEADEEARDAAALQRDAGSLFLVTHISGRSAAHAELLSATLDQGGCVVFSRSKANMRDVARLVFDHTRAQQAANQAVAAHFVILDEADRMRGTGARSACAQHVRLTLDARRGGGRVSVRAAAG